MCEVKLFIDYCQYTADQNSVITENNRKGFLNEVDSTGASKELCGEESLVDPFVVLGDFLPQGNAVAGRTSWS